MSKLLRIRRPLALVVCVIAISCSKAPSGPPTREQSADASELRVTSPSFANGESIPVKHTCDGGDLSPVLKLGQVPAGTKTLALVCDDPDAPGGTWVHWVLYNLPASVSELPEGLPATEILSNKAVQGRNDFGKFGYGGPCPPAGATHRYFFKVYAVDVDLEPKGGATKQALESAMRGHILAQGTLIGKYARSKG